MIDLSHKKSKGFLVSVSVSIIHLGGKKTNYDLVLFILSEKKRYRESYISDDLDLDPPGSESSPGLSRHSTSSSGIEADARQHSISTELASMEDESQRQGEQCLSSAASRSSSCTSGFDAGCKGRIEDDGWQDEGERSLLRNMGNSICLSRYCVEFTDN